MNLAVSNIAWSAEDEPRAAEILCEIGVTGVEIAPTRVWPSPGGLNDDIIQAHRHWWESRGIRIVALQALLFGRDDLTLFDAPETRRRTLEHLASMVRLAAGLGAGILVFGSPRNRRRGALSMPAAWSTAVDFFRELGELAAAHHINFCIEPNPPAYGCDFVTTSSEGVQLVEAVSSSGFGLHLDAGGLTLSGENVPTALRHAAPVLKHVHLSEPQLAPLGTGGTDHESLSAGLTAIGYNRWLSIEMRLDSQAWRRHLVGAVKLAKMRYGP